MIGIVDSGSTKSSWVFVDKNQKRHNVKTVGINPYYQTAEDIYSSLKAELLPNLPAEEGVDKIFFYGAGCEEKKQKDIVADGLRKAFPQSDLMVDHDLLAAARALFGDEAGIACISGTGANTCYYDGKKIVRNIYSPGLSLGDEGSGGFLGRMVARDYMRRVLPQAMMEKFETFTKDRADDIMEKVYRKPFPNRYLASLAPFVIQNQQDPHMYQLAYENFNQMFVQCVCRYENYQKLPIRFVGSIAAYLRPVLDKVAADHGCKVDKVIGSPMDTLADYHMQRSFAL